MKLSYQPAVCETRLSFAETGVKQILEIKKIGALKAAALPLLGWRHR